MAQIQSVFDVERILSAIGIDARRNSSGEWKAKCPMHYERLGRQDRKPSWSINESTGAHNCFSCMYSGTIVDLVCDLTDMSPWEAMRWLRSEGMQSLDVVYRDIIEDTPEPLLNLAPSFSEQWLSFKRPPKVEREDRHITANACEYFDVRWDNAWAIPIKDWRGKLMGYQLKSGPFVKNEPEGVQKSNTLFGIDVFPAGETAVLVESPLDVLRLWQAGHHGVASFGVYVSKAQVELLHTFTDRLVLGLDFDAIGRQQARKLYKSLRNTMPDLRFLNYTVARGEDGKLPKDVGDMTDEQIDAAVAQAVTASEALTLRLMAAKDEMPQKPDKKPAVRRSGRGRR